MKKSILKKALGIGMAAVITAGSVIGCGGNSKSGNDAETKENDEIIELVMYVVGDRPAGQDVVEDNLNELLKEKIGATLRINWVGWAEYQTKYPLLFSSGESFDMAYGATWLQFYTMAAQGAFMDLDELWPTYAPKNFEKTSEAAKQQATVNGHYYCVPSLLSTYNDYGIIYRKDILDGTDWDGKIETFEDVEEYCDLVKETHPEMEPLDICAPGSEWGNLFVYSTGLDYLDRGRPYLVYDAGEEHPEVKYTFDVEGMEEFLEMMTVWNEKGFFSKSALSDTDTTKTANGKAAVKVHNIDTYRDLCVQHPEYEFGFADFVKGTAHLPNTQDCMVISNTSEHPEKALEFWDLVTSDQEVYNAFYYGVEGTTYELNDQNEFGILDNDLYATSSMYAARTDGLTLNQIGTPADYQESLDTYESEIKEGEGKEKYVGFIFDATNVQTEIASCSNTYRQYFYPLSLGYTDIESGPE